jgi:hypothetical protein
LSVVSLLRLRRETEVLLLLPRLSMPVAFTMSKVVVRLRVLPVSQDGEAIVRVSVAIRGMTGLTVSSANTVSLGVNVQSMQNKFPPTDGLVVIVKMIALKTVSSVRIVLVMTKNVPRPHANTNRSAGIFVSVIGNDSIALMIIIADLVVFALAFAELSLGRSHVTDLGGIIIIIT